MKSPSVKIQIKAIKQTLRKIIGQFYLNSVALSVNNKVI